MKSIRFIIASAAILTFGIANAKAPDNEPNNNNNANNLNKSLANNCRPSQAVVELDLNNIRARLETGNIMWMNRQTSTPAYFAPKPPPGQPGPASIFAGALWMGGIAPDGVLKLGANKFRSGGRNDFFTGPLEAGTGETNLEDCNRWDRFFPISQAEVRAHKAFFDCQEDPDCDLAEQGLDGYVIPDRILRWPGNGIQGGVNPRHDPVIAPFFDRPGVGVEDEYEPEQGDYPFYDLTGEIECFSDDRRVPLFGDFTFYWVFNDRGNVHTESLGDPIGMEVRTQGFAFVTDDEINNMTFYNYTLINQGSQTLNDTWFGQWVDPDIGGSEDDYVGSDVARGLGFAFNGDGFDATQGASIGYESFPPAIGVDFFQGPYQDNDGIDNPLTQDLSWSDLDALRGIPYAGIGIGYSDDIIDNERFGMRRFVYHERTGNQINVDPQFAPQYYNFLTGRWRNGQRMTFGGLGLTPPNPTDPWSGPNPVTDYMFPSDPTSNVNSDPFGFGVRGRTDLPPWNEFTVPNPLGDRRFMQSAGPFTLQPGAVNNITVGVVWAQTPTAGGNRISVQLMKVANTKAQNLFDNCFQILDGPNAPMIQIRELENELILYLVNPPSSNNVGLRYEELDPNIPDTRFDENGLEIENDKFYRFEGYKVFQVRDATVSVADLADVNRARLIFQTDIRNGITDIINFIQDEEDPLPFAVPTRMVRGTDEGIVQAIRVTEDAFATGESRRLINHKTYHFIAISYAFNNFLDYDPVTLLGQARAYLPSRSGPGGSGSPIISYSGIPHATEIRNGGTVLNSRFGDEFFITRFEGDGNGGSHIRITPESEQQLFDFGVIANPRYERGFAPLNVRVVDPMRVKDAQFEMVVNFDDEDWNDDEAEIFWKLIVKDDLGNILDEAVSDRAISIKFEQLFQSYGISVTVDNPEMLRGFGPSPPDVQNHYPILASGLTFPANGPRWLAGIPDNDECSPLNWIRQGETINEEVPACNDRFDLPTDFENIAGGIVGPWNLVHAGVEGPSAAQRLNQWHAFRDAAIANYPSVEIVLTPDKSKWTRAMVVELQDNTALAVGNAPKMSPRRSPSVDKNGNPHTGAQVASQNPDDANFISPTGMGWFPGYVYDVESGERLNLAFGENSFLSGDNGNDMLWNPSNRVRQNPLLGDQWFLGGQHYVYIFRNYDRERRRSNPNAAPAIGAYDEGRYMIANPVNNNLWRATSWVFFPRLADGHEWRTPQEGLVPGEARLSVRIAKPLLDFNPYVTAPDAGDIENNANPLFRFSTSGSDALFNQLATKKDAFKNVRIVPNPYYAYTSYEANRNDTRIRITNLPMVATINIYNVNGTLVRTLRKGDDVTTSIDWDLRNEAQIPIAGGVYLFHIDAPGVGETVLKWFGSLRQQDFENF
ncbi:MAG: hypothetical protein ACXITV_10570 [Luteibaculaceae bacterium]